MKLKKLLFTVLLLSMSLLTSWVLDLSQIQSKSHLFAGPTDDQPGPY